MELKDFTSLLETPVNSLLNTIGNELKQLAKNRILEYQITEYKRNFYSKTLLHRSEPVKLTDFYLPLHISKTQSFSHYNKAQTRISTQKIETVFSKTNFITLIGNAGSGKSTIVKYMYINAVESSFKIPIKVELRYLNDYSKSLTDYIYDEIFTFYKLGFSTDIIERLLNSGKFIFFLDGYDEINSTKKENFTNELDKFVSRFPNNCYLITSRPYTNIEILPLFTNYSVCELLDDEIPFFVKKQTANAEEELSEKIIKAIKQIDNNSYRAFLQNPLLLSMFILTFQSYSEIPQKRSEFYKQVFDTLYSVHDSVSKLSYVREKISGLSREKFEEVLKLFSFLSYFESKFLFKKEYLDDKLTFIKEKKADLSFENDKIIQDLQVSIGILNKEGTEYAFPHRSLQEYFSANYISSLSENNKEIMFKRIKEIVEKNWMFLIDNHHFLLLLSEQDYSSVLRYVAIPLLQNQLKRLKATRLSLKAKYDIQAKIYLISLELIQKTIRIEKIHTEFCPLLHDDGIYIGNEKYAFEYPKEETKKIKEKTNEIAKNLLEKGPFWLEDIIENLKKEEKSDEEIIIGLI